MIRFKVDKSDRKFISQKNVQRASRLAINEATNEAHKELGGTIPRAHGTSVTGYRRVRSKKKLAKARRRKMQGVVWQGLNQIQGTYAGKARKVKGGIKAGRHFFPNAFKITFKSGHVGIFRRINGKLTEEMIDLDQAKAMTRRKASETLRTLPERFRKQYKKLVRK